MHKPLGGAATITVSYKHDALGNLIERRHEQGGTTATERYAYDGPNVWADLDGSGTLRARRLFGDGADDAVARLDYASGPDPLLWYWQDRQGSVVGHADGSSGPAVRRRRFGAFGREHDITGPWPSTATLTPAARPTRPRGCSTTASAGTTWRPCAGCRATRSSWRPATATCIATWATTPPTPATRRG